MSFFECPLKYFTYLIFCSFNKYLLSSYYEPRTVPGWENIAKNTVTGTSACSGSLMLQWKRKKRHETSIIWIDGTWLASAKREIKQEVRWEGSGMLLPLKESSKEASVRRWCWSKIRRRWRLYVLSNTLGCCFTRLFWSRLAHWSEQNRGRSIQQEGRKFWSSLLIHACLKVPFFVTAWL